MGGNVGKVFNGNGYDMLSPVFTVSDFVAVLNQTLEFSYPYIEIEGEISNFRVSRNKWVYFDLKDETASLKCFATVYALPGPLEDGMVVRVAGSPRLHPLYNFSFQTQSIIPVGEGALRRAAELLKLKLEREGLFDQARKRSLLYPPSRVALITAKQSAAYADFIKIVGERWGGLKLDHYNVLVQGEQAPEEIVNALKMVNETELLSDVVVLIRGGGSADDLAAWNDERVVRAIAGSRLPTLVAIGHEVDISLSELAADQRASTPSNAAELLVPDKHAQLGVVRHFAIQLDEYLMRSVKDKRLALRQANERLNSYLNDAWAHTCARFDVMRQLLTAYNPHRPLLQGYVLIRKGDSLVTTINQLYVRDTIKVNFADGMATACVDVIKKDRKVMHD